MMYGNRSYIYLVYSKKYTYADLIFCYGKPCVFLLSEGRMLQMRVKSCSKNYGNKL